jgi:hypothetical protein
MGVCSTGNCIKSYLFEREVYIQGNKIFKPINTNLDVNNEQLSPEEKQTLENCKKLLEEIENKRKEIAAKFECFLFNMGGCVLTQPTMERGLITYVVNLLTQIIICANQKKVEFNKDDFALSNFITISKNPPFFELNNDTLNNLKNKYGFDFNMIESLVKGKESIIDFLSTVTSTKSLMQNQLDVLKSLLKEKIRDIFMVKQIYNSIDGIIFLINYFSEISNGIMDTQLKLTKPRKIETYYKIASKAAERNIKDPKEIALLYAYGDNCGKIENWKENMTYKEMDPIKY